MTKEFMADDPLMVTIVLCAQVAGATSCHALFTAGGKIRVWTPLWGLARAMLEERLRCAPSIPEWYEIRVLENRT